MEIKNVLFYFSAAYYEISHCLNLLKKTEKRGEKKKKERKEQKKILSAKIAVFLKINYKFTKILKKSF